MMTYETFRDVLTYASLVAFAAFAAATGICVLAVHLAPIVRWTKHHCLEALLVSPFVVCMVWYGGAKHGSVAFPYTDPERRYLYDAGSYVTNGYAHVAFRTLLIPQSATIYAYSRPAGSTNDTEWTERMSDLLSDFSVSDGVYSRDVYFEGVETNDLQVFTDWTPGPAAHTNGIAEILWRKGYLDPASAAAVPWRTGIYIEGRRVAPAPTMTNGLPASFSLQLAPDTDTQNEETDE